jgi:flagellar biosynthetic protein FliP
MCNWQRPKCMSLLLLCICLLGLWNPGFSIPEEAMILPKLDLTDTGDTPFPFAVNIGLQHSESPKEIAKGVQIVIFLTILSLAPSLFVMVTSYTRIVVILGFLKRASGVGQQPSPQIIAGLALFLTVYIMAPVGEQINEKAIKPYLNEEITQQEALTELVKPLRVFMFKFTREKDLALFIHIAKMDKPTSRVDVPTYILIPAYVISELKTAFQVGFLLFLPFLVIDMTVASVLLSMGMIVLPPVTISMPFKILLFVMVDGWYLIVRSITLGFA